MGQLGAISGADETQAKHRRLQLQRGNALFYIFRFVIPLKVFQRIDDDFRLIMGDAVKDPRVIAILRLDKIKRNVCILTK